MLIVAVILRSASAEVNEQGTNVKMPADMAYHKEAGKEEKRQVREQHGQDRCSSAFRSISSGVVEDESSTTPETMEGEVKRCRVA